MVMLLVDGHHHILLSLHFKAKTVPIKQIADFSQMSSEDFWKKAEKMGLAHLKKLSGKRSIPPRNFSDLQDDPGRYFAAITCRKYSEDFSISSGAEYPLWIKIGRDIPFIEFYISDALRQRGIIYDSSMGDTPPEEFMEKAREALLDARIPELKVLSKRIHHKEIRDDQGSFNPVVISSPKKHLQNSLAEKQASLL